MRLNLEERARSVKDEPYSLGAVGDIDLALRVIQKLGGLDIEISAYPFSTTGRKVCFSGPLEEEALALLLKELLAASPTGEVLVSQRITTSTY